MDYVKSIDSNEISKSRRRLGSGHKQRFQDDSNAADELDIPKVMDTMMKSVG
jgi:hypothetical protein